MIVPFYTSTHEYAARRDEFDSAVRSVMERGDFILSSESEEFEKEAADWLGAKYAVGVANKQDVDDFQESPALLEMESVARRGAKVLCHDPYIPEVTDDHGKTWKGMEFTDEALSSAYCAVFATNHALFDVERIVENARLVVDTRNAVKRVHIEDGKVYKL